MEWSRDMGTNCNSFCNSETCVFKRSSLTFQFVHPLTTDPLCQVKQYRASAQPNKQQHLQKIYNLLRGPMSSQRWHRDLYSSSVKPIIRDAMGYQSPKTCSGYRSRLCKGTCLSWGHWYRRWPGNLPLSEENAKTTLTSRTSGHHCPLTWFPSWHLLAGLARNAFLFGMQSSFLLSLTL